MTPKLPPGFRATRWTGYDGVHGAGLGLPGGGVSRWAPGEWRTVAIRRSVAAGARRTRGRNTSRERPDPGRILHGAAPAATACFVSCSPDITWSMSITT